MRRWFDSFVRSQICLSFFQILTSLHSTYSVPLPEYYMSWTRVLTLVQLDWSSLILPGDCVGSFDVRLLVNALTPLVFVIVTLAAFTLREGVTLTLSSATAAQRTAERRLIDLIHAKRYGVVTVQLVLRGLQSTAPFALLVTFALVPSVTAIIFQTWSCEGFAYSQTEDQRFYMRKAPSIRCYASDDHARVQGVAWPLIALWPIGCLVLYTALLWRARTSILSRTPNRLVRCIAFLHRDCTSAGTQTSWLFARCGRLTVICIRAAADQIALRASLGRWARLHGGRRCSAGCCSSMNATRLFDLCLRC